jgi:hypothetical protein
MSSASASHESPGTRQSEAGVCRHAHCTDQPPREPTAISCEGCSLGQAMCDRPCWGTPKDITRLVELGLGDRLMLAIFVSRDFEIVEVLTPAIPGLECRHNIVAGQPRATGGCVFQDRQTRRCMVHQWKPTEGQIACCQRFRGESGRIAANGLRARLAMSWMSPEGSALVQRWSEQFLPERRLSIEELHRHIAAFIARALWDRVTRDREEIATSNHSALVLCETRGEN